MKKRINITTYRWFALMICISIASGLFQACDKIDGPYLVKVESSDTLSCPPPEFPNVIDDTKRVLLEDYTGHTCVNCPSAAIIARNLKAQYGDKLVVMAVHAGGFAQPQSNTVFTYNFLTAAGTAWDTKFGISKIGNPNGMVNRRKINNTVVLGTSAWSGAVAEMTAEAALLDVKIINEYSSGENKLCTHIQTKFLQAIDKNLKLIVALTEDSIVAPQKNLNSEIGPVPVITNYVHMHVLRGAITSTMGTPISSIGVENSTPVVKSYRYTIKDNWVPKNCRVVAFVYDADTDEVLQAAEAAVISE